VLKHSRNLVILCSHVAQGGIPWVFWSALRQQIAHRWSDRKRTVETHRLRVLKKFRRNGYSLMIYAAAAALVGTHFSYKYVRHRNTRRKCTLIASRAAP